MNGSRPCQVLPRQPGTKKLATHTVSEMWKLGTVIEQDNRISGSSMGSRSALEGKSQSPREIAGLKSNSRIPKQFE